MNKKILIVEDEGSLLNALEEKFKGHGFIIVEAKNGKEGMTMALAERPDLILLDIVMPIMDGMSMLHELRKDEWGKDAQIIMLTNLSDSEEVAQCISEGVHDYLVKSDWRLEDLLQKVKEKLGA